MDLHVSRMCLSSSGGSFVVKYDASVEISSTDPRIDVEIVSTWPANADPGCVERELESIRRGAETVLGPLGHGAAIRVRELVIHPVDFKASKYEAFTAEEFRRIVNARIEPENAAERKPAE